MYLREGIEQKLECKRHRARAEECLIFLSAVVFEAETAKLLIRLGTYVAHTLF